MTEKKGLQNFTNTTNKIQVLLKSGKLKKDDISDFQDEEWDELGNQITEYLNKSKGEERDEFLYQVEDILPTDTKNQIWENNHYQITVSMTKLIEETGKMPTKNQLAKASGLSRQTIYNHLKSYDEHPLYTKQFEQFRFMADRVLAKVIKIAVQGEGNIKAARLYFDIMGKSFNTHLNGNTLIHNQNNYIQINGLLIEAEKIKELPAESIEAIKRILNGSSKNIIPDNG